MLCPRLSPMQVNMRLGTSSENLNKSMQNKTQRRLQSVAALRKMAGKLRIKESEEQQHLSSSKWTRLVDRGGIIYADVVYDLFVTIVYSG